MRCCMTDERERSAEADVEPSPPWPWGAPNAFFSARSMTFHDCEVKISVASSPLRYLRDDIKCGNSACLHDIHDALLPILKLLPLDDRG